MSDFAYYFAEGNAKQNSGDDSAPKSNNRGKKVPAIQTSRFTPIIFPDRVYASTPPVTTMDDLETLFDFDLE